MGCTLRRVLCIASIGANRFDRCTVWRVSPSRMRSRYRRHQYPRWRVIVPLSILFICQFLSLGFGFATGSLSAAGGEFAAFRLRESGPPGLAGLPSQSNPLFLWDSLPTNFDSEFRQCDCVWIFLLRGHA